MKIYLDNCCLNRPYDDQSQLRISLETQAKLYIQNLIKNKQVEMVTSYVLQYENSENPFDMRKRAITDFMIKNSTIHIGVDKADVVKDQAEIIMQTGIKTKDAFHVSCAIEAECEYFISTDDRLLKYKTDRIELVDPIDFIKKWEVNENE